MFRPPRGCELVATLGRGSTFVVALCKRGDSRVIVKRATFEATVIAREVWVLERWKHRAAPIALEHGTDDAGPFIVETAAAGEPLRALRERRSPVPVQACRELVAAFEDLHAHGVVHADPSPDNVFVAGTDVTLIDFGGSGAARGDEPAPLGRGTLPYVAPELARSEVAPSPATDRYGLAVLIAELVSGAPLCTATTDASRLLSIGERGHDLSPLFESQRVPEQMRAALAHLLAFSPAERDAGLGTLGRALQDWVDERAPSS